MIQKVISGLLLLSIISSLNAESVKVIVEIPPTYNYKMFVHVYSPSGTFSYKQVFGELGVIEVPLEEDLADLKLDAVLSSQMSLEGMFGVPIMGGNLEKKDSVWLIRSAGLGRVMLDGKKCPDECDLEGRIWDKLVTPVTTPTTTVFPDSTDSSSFKTDSSSSKTGSTSSKTDSSTFETDSSTTSDSTSTESGMATSLHDSTFVLLFSLIFSFLIKNKLI